MSIVYGVAAIAALAGPIEFWSGMYQIDPRITAGIIWVESRGKPDVGNRNIGIGLMGVVSDTAYEELIETEENLSSGTWYLRYVLDETKGNVRRALVAYNMGLAGAEEAGWELSMDGSRYLNAFAEGWGKLFRNEPLPWEAKPLRGECEE